MRRLCRRRQWLLEHQIREAGLQTAQYWARIHLYRLFDDKAQDWQNTGGTRAGRAALAHQSQKECQRIFYGTTETTQRSRFRLTVSARRVRYSTGLMVPMNRSLPSPGQHMEGPPADRSKIRSDAGFYGLESLLWVFRIGILAHMHGLIPLGAQYHGPFWPLSHDFTGDRLTHHPSYFVYRFSGIGTNPSSTH